MRWSSTLGLLYLGGAAALSSTNELGANNKVAQLNLRRTKSKAKSSEALLANVVANSVGLAAIEHNSAFGVATSLGSNGVFELLFDTGSSDLWTATSDFQCMTAKGQPVAQSKCGFSKTFSGPFTGGAIPDENFNISYAGGQYSVGTMGYELVSIEGIEIEKQEIALVNETYFAGAHDSAGLIGFAYPALTSAHRGSDSGTDEHSNLVIYKNWITNAIKQNLIAPMFSLALMRKTAGLDKDGILTLGGLPNVSFTQNFTTTPIVKAEIFLDPIENSRYSYYTIIPDGVEIAGKAISTNKELVIVDSGTTLIYLPVNITKALAASFDPPATYHASDRMYLAQCNATVPTFGITINGTTLAINSAEVLMEFASSRSELCVLGVQPSQGSIILGDSFLNNVVAVFDIGAAQMHFAPHVY